MQYQFKLKCCGIKITPHKIAILELFYQHKHLTATQVIHSLKAKQIEISLATVYRILASFEMHKLIRKHNFDNEQAIYEINHENEHHDHLICIVCGNVIEFNNSQIEHLQQEIAKKNQFVLISHELNIYGRCKNCKVYK